MLSTAYTASLKLRASLGRRGVAALLALLIELLIALLLLFMAPTIPGREKGKGRPTVFGIDVSSDESSDATEKAEAKAAARARTDPPPRPAPVPPPPPPDAPEPPPPPVETPPTADFLRITRRDYAAGDIARAPSTPGAAAPGDAAEQGSAAAAGGRMPGDSEVAGKAPNGEPLYAAEWYRRPTNAELSPYISRRALSSGWGLIACRTVSAYRVEDCQELGEGPRGSGLAGSVRQAAWQFRVRPPRVGGRELIGGWVSIRIDYTITREGSSDRR
jgi:hypothetical protein